MVRWITVTLLLSACGVAAVWMLFPHLISPPPAPAASTADADEAKNTSEQASGQSRKRTSTSTPHGSADVTVYSNAAPRDLIEPIIIPDGYLVIVDKQEVASEKEGILKFIGTDVGADETVPQEKQLPDAVLGVLAIPVGDKPISGEECFQPQGDKTYYRRARLNERFEPKKVSLMHETRRLKKLQIGDWVTRGQLLGMVNPAKASDDVAVKIAKLDAVEVARAAAFEQKEEYRRRYENYRRIDRDNGGAIPRDTLMETHLQWVKFNSEEMVKREEIKEAASTLNAAVTDLRMHEIHAAIDGVVRAIIKNHQGDAVKPNETIMRIENPSWLRVEGRLEVQEALKLKKGMTAIVEANRPEAPRQVIVGHLRAVNCVAVSKGKRPIVVSGSDDETLRGWDAATGLRLWMVYLHSSVRSVACSPKDSKRNLACFGCADGTVRLLDLDDPNQKPREMDERHRGPVLGVAFSPDGEMIATCGDDRVIRMWKTETGALSHVPLVNAHNGAVTSVQFASPTQLVSAGKDNRLAVWDVEEGKPLRLVGERITGRGGYVTVIGVSPDGKTALYDQGKELRLLTLEDRHLAGSLQKSSEPDNFSTMALFSPDGKTILTNRSAPGKLQLWRTPPAKQMRGSELRQFIWSTPHGTCNCGAFAPDGTFAVTGMEDHKVLVWMMPSKEEIDSRLEAKLTLVEKYLDTHSRHVRVRAELQAPEWLIPGMRATMVVPQQQK
jgi:WD40 repeat protein